MKYLHARAALDATEKEGDHTMLSDIFPTGWHSTRLAGLEPGQSIVIYGAGPVGLMAALSARIQGASQIFVVDGLKDRLALAEQIGCTPIDSMGDVAGQIREATNGLGADCGFEVSPPTLPGPPAEPRIVVNNPSSVHPDERKARHTSSFNLVPVHDRSLISGGLHRRRVPSHLELPSGSFQTWVWSPLATAHDLCGAPPPAHHCRASTPAR